MSSFSDDDPSEDSRTRMPRNPPPPPPTQPHAKPRKKKKKLPPQEAINKIWTQFSAPKFSKATVILPQVDKKSTPSPSAPPPLPRPDNLLVSEDYERAVQECRSKVRKLIKECKRVNMRYRDPDFDIDWDLKWEKGYCLNGLVEDKFDVGSTSGLSVNVPKAVKRVHEIFEKPTFAPEKVSPADVKQGGLGDCWLMAGLTALANMEVGIRRICVEYDTKIGIYGFVFHRDGEWVISIIDDKLYLKSPDWDSPSVQRHLLEQIDREDVESEYRKTYQTGSEALFFAHCKDQNETWLPLLEKAYAKAHGDYAALAGGWTGEGLEDLTGGVTTELLTSDILDTDEFWKNEILKVNKEFLFGCSTGHLDNGYGNRDGISEGHAYVVMEARELSTGERLLKLRNPWGKGKRGIWEGPWSDGSKEFTPEAQIELNHKFGNDSVFWISYPDLLRKYQHFDRTRLFMDSLDWRITQKWMSVEVPWKAKYEERFRLTLTKESPVVLVLSQLDERYFDGLQGQYSFRLQFRLHEVDCPDEDDYIVRSHGNYLMERSVVAELKSLKAGTYSMLVMVVADRDTTAQSVEDVIKQQTRQREDNEKLAQVGMAYDLAHSKAAVHIAAKIAKQKELNKAEASKTRIELRKKNWERRHQQREIMRRQDKKNQDKREKKEAKDAAEAKEKEELEKAEKVKKEEQEKVEKSKGEGKDDLQAEESAELEKEETPKQDSQGPKDQGSQTDETTEKEDKAVQTEDQTPITQPSSPAPASEQLKENEKACQTEEPYPHAISNTTHTTPITPNSTLTSPAQSPPPPRHRPRRRSHTIHCRPPYPNAHPHPHPHAHPTTYGPPQPTYSLPHFPLPPTPPPPSPQPHRHGVPPPLLGRAQQNGYLITSDGDSSASPLSDFDDLYTDDDPSLRPRALNSTGEGRRKKESSEEESEGSDAGRRRRGGGGGYGGNGLFGSGGRFAKRERAEPWNAVCVVGLRVYGKDGGLRVEVVEGGEDVGEVRVGVREREKRERKAREGKERKEAEEKAKEEVKAEEKEEEKGGKEKFEAKNEAKPTEAESSPTQVKTEPTDEKPDIENPSIPSKDTPKQESTQSHSPTIEEKPSSTSPKPAIAEALSTQQVEEPPTSASIESTPNSTIPEHPPAVPPAVSAAPKVPASAADDTTPLRDSHVPPEAPDPPTSTRASMPPLFRD